MNGAMDVVSAFLDRVLVVLGVLLRVGLVAVLVGVMRERSRERRMELLLWAVLLAALGANNMEMWKGSGCSWST